MGLWQKVKSFIARPILRHEIKKATIKEEKLKSQGFQVTKIAKPSITNVTKMSYTQIKDAIGKLREYNKTSYVMGHGGAPIQTKTVSEIRKVESEYNRNIEKLGYAPKGEDKIIGFESLSVDQMKNMLGTNEGLSKKQHSISTFNSEQEAREYIERTMHQADLQTMIEKSNQPIINAQSAATKAGFTSLAEQISELTPEQAAILATRSDFYSTLFGAFYTGNMSILNEAGIADYLSSIIDIVKR